MDAVTGRHCDENKEGTRFRGHRMESQVPWQRKIFQDTHEIPDGG